MTGVQTCALPISKKRHKEEYNDGQDGKTYCLDTGNTNAIEKQSRIRRLTPLECERLQTMKDGYTAHVSQSRYKRIGNGFTIEVIAHIFSYLE